MDVDSRQLRLALLMVPAISLGLGCASANAAKKQDTALGTQQGIRISRAELRVRVRSLALPFSGIIEEAADSAIVETTDPEVRKIKLLWKINGIPAMQAALFQPDPLAALIDAWALTVQMRNSVLSGPGSVAPDEIKSDALRAVAQMESELLKIGQLLGPAEAVEDLRRDVEAWAEKNPIDNSLAARTLTSGELAAMTADNKVGIRKTVAVANETMSDLATRMDVYTSYMPKQARWQAEYLVSQLVAGEDVGTAFRDFSELSAAVSKMAETVVLAPGIVASEREAVLEALQIEREAAIEAIQEQLVTALEFISNERIEIFTTHLEAERKAILEAVERERTIALDALREERVAALEQVGVMTEEVVADSLKGIVDHFFIRLAQVGLVLLIIVGAAFWFLRRKAP